MAATVSARRLGVDVDAGHLGAAGGQRLGDRAAQAAGRAGHQRHLVLQVDLHARFGSIGHSLLFGGLTSYGLCLVTTDS